jgi:chromate transporter
MNDRPRARVGEILVRFLRLGCTSFGGPVAHLGYFREEFVTRLGWLEEARFAEVVGLCQFLPGPASSQVGFTIGLMEGGLMGALAAWVGFTLPSALLMLGFAYGHRWLKGAVGLGVLHGLGLGAVAVVAQAVWGMRQALAPDGRRMMIGAVAAGIVLGWHDARGQMVALAMGALAGLVLCRSVGEPAGGWLVGISRRWSVLAAGIFLGLLVGLPALSLFGTFYRAGALVFGGGHVVLPLLERVTVGRGWVDEGTFLAGYGGAQTLPGPLFTFAAYLGAVSSPKPGVLGGLIALAGIFTGVAAGDCGAAMVGEVEAKCGAAGGDCGSECERGGSVAGGALPAGVDGCGGNGLGWGDSCRGIFGFGGLEGEALGGGGVVGGCGGVAAGLGGVG